MASRLGSRRKQGKINTIIRRDGDVCHYCHRALNDNIRTLDHLIPLSDGGVNANSNLVLACYDCNHRRGDTTYKAYKARKRTTNGLTYRPFTNMDIELDQRTMFDG